MSSPSVPLTTWAAAACRSAGVAIVASYTLARLTSDVRDRLAAIGVP